MWKRKSERGDHCKSLLSSWHVAVIILRWIISPNRTRVSRSDFPLQVSLWMQSCPPPLAWSRAFSLSAFSAFYLHGSDIGSSSGWFFDSFFVEFMGSFHRMSKTLSLYAAYSLLVNFHVVAVTIYAADYPFRIHFVALCHAAMRSRSSSNNSCCCRHGNGMLGLEFSHLSTGRRLHTHTFGQDFFYYFASVLLPFHYVRSFNRNCWSRSSSSNIA